MSSRKSQCLIDDDALNEELLIRSRFAHTSDGDIQKHLRDEEWATLHFAKLTSCSVLSGVRAVCNESVVLSLNVETQRCMSHFETWRQDYDQQMSWSKPDRI